MPPLGIEFTPRFRAAARSLPADRQDQIEAGIELLRDSIGKPHVHAGLGIRRLRANYFEFRAGRDLRVIFSLERNTATLRMVGGHDEVRRYLKNL